MENKIMKKKENIKKTYSQKEQDLWVVKKLRAKKNGFFVEVGAAGQELCEILKNNGYVIDGGNPYDKYFTNFNL